MAIIGQRGHAINTDVGSYGRSLFEIQSRGSAMSDKEVDNLIDKLCEARNDNPDAKLLDDIHSGNIPNEASYYNSELEETKTAMDIENEIVKDLIENPNISIEEMNMLKANGIYNRYEQMRPKIQGDDIMESMEDEIMRDMEIIDQRINNASAHVVQEEETNMIENETPTFQEEAEDVNNITEDNVQETAESGYVDSEGRTQETIDNLNDVPAATLEVEDTEIESKLKKTIGSNIDADDVVKLLDVIKRYKAGEKFNVYRELPPIIQAEINKAAIENGVQDRSIINFFAKNFINDLIADAYLDKEFTDFQTELGNITAGLDNMPGFVIDSYNDELKEKFEDKMLELAKKVEEEDPEKAKQLENISMSFRASYTLERVFDTFMKRPSLLNKAYKEARDSWTKYRLIFDEKVSHINPKVKSIDTIVIPLMNRLGYSEVGARSLAVLVGNSIMAAINESDTVDSHVYAYFTIRAFANINMTAKQSYITNTLCESIYRIMIEMENYIEKVNAEKPQKKGKKKNKRR